MVFSPEVSGCLAGYLATRNGVRQGPQPQPIGLLLTSRSSACGQVVDNSGDRSVDKSGYPERTGAVRTNAPNGDAFGSGGGEVRRVRCGIPDTSARDPILRGAIALS